MLLLELRTFHSQLHVECI